MSVSSRHEIYFCTDGYFDRFIWMDEYEYEYEYEYDEYEYVGTGW